MLGFENLDELDRYALILAKLYEQQRREAQRGYSLKRTGVDQEYLKTPVFKQFRTVAKWFLDQHWKPGVDNVHWKGYVRYLFQQLSPKIPQPGQLKNKMTLAQYQKSVPPILGSRRKSKEQLEEFYQRILRKDLPGRDAIIKGLSGR